MSEIYRAPDAIQLASAWGLRIAEREWQSAVKVGDTAPIITRHGLRLAQLGLSPSRAANELVPAGIASVPIIDASSKAAARGPFERQRWCVIPALAFFLTRSRQVAGGSEIWKFSRNDLQGFGIAGLYDRRRTPLDGREVSWFAMLTVDSGSHPLLAEFGRIRDPRSGVVSSQAPLLLDRTQYEQWLGASIAEAMQIAEQGLKDQLTAEAPARQALPRSNLDGVASVRGSLVSAFSPTSAGADALPLIAVLP